MFENVESKNAVKNSVTKRKAMRVADDVSVAEDLMLEFDAIRVSRRGRASADVQDDANSQIICMFGARAERNFVADSFWTKACFYGFVVNFIDRACVALTSLGTNLS